MQFSQGKSATCVHKVPQKCDHTQKMVHEDHQGSGLTVVCTPNINTYRKNSHQVREWRRRGPSTKDNSSFVVRPTFLFYLVASVYIRMKEGYVLYVDHEKHPAPLSMCYHATGARRLSSTVDRYPPATLTEVDSAYCPQCLSYHDAASAARMGK